MRRVLHIGPYETPGGMAKVMQILAENPPEGWHAELLSSHVNGNPLSKWFAYRKGIKRLKKIINSTENTIDMVHVHTAADWSWWRKKRFVKLASKNFIPCIIHIHSGKFEQWLTSTNSKRAISMRNFINNTNSTVVVLNNNWKERLQPYIGYCNVISNPIDPMIIHDKNLQRDKNHLLLLGRNDPVKGHIFAIKLCQSLLSSFPKLKLSMTGIEFCEHKWVNARGWISEQEKISLLQTASLLIAPSGYEGQPLVILEALASGLPCLASDKIYDLPEVVDYAEFENINAWKKQVEEILSKDIDANELVSSVSSFSVENVAANWKRIYENQFN